MDPDVAIMYQVSGERVVTRDKLKVNLSDAYNRQKLPKCHEDSIDLVWKERCKANPKLWNGTKFRLAAAYTEHDYAVFDLGITSYKDFIGTNWSPSAKLYQDIGKADSGNTQVHLSDALGVGALVETADNTCILLRRSQHCGEAVGLMDYPGGHPEPQELVGKIEASSIDLKSLSAVDVVNEIFDSVVREICDEVNIPMDSLTEPQLIGVARNTTSAGRPSSYYYVRCSLTSKDIQTQYSQGDHPEAEESTGIVFLPMAQIPTLHQDKAVWNDLAPSAKGCTVLYQQYISVLKS